MKRVWGRLCQLLLCTGIWPTAHKGALCRPPQVRWITFHSGYDFGYLVKLLTCSSLPANESEFFELLKVSLDQRSVGLITTCAFTVLAEPRPCICSSSSLKYLT